MKGLPLAYSKDMQEDKEQVFDAAESLELSIAAMTGMVSRHGGPRGQMRKAAGSGYSTATDLADWLVREAGLPFRDAHHVTGRAVAHGRGKTVRGIAEDLSLEDLQTINPAITSGILMC
jgi:argininosuccinate lyase